MPKDPSGQPAPAQAQDPAGTAAPATPRARTLGRWLLRALGVLVAFILAGALMAALLANLRVGAEELQAWSRISATIHRWGLLAQCLALAAVGLWWRQIVTFGLRRGVVRPDEFDRVLRLRGVVLAFGVAYLLLVPIGPTTLWRFVFQ